NGRLEGVVNALDNEERPIFIKKMGTYQQVTSELGSVIWVHCGPHGLEHLGPKFEVGFDPPPLWFSMVGGGLHRDLQLIWQDFCIIVSQRQPDDWGFTEYFLAYALSTGKLDIIFSKYGFRTNHHFYHWKAVSNDVSNAFILDADDFEPGGFKLV